MFNLNIGPEVLGEIERAILASIAEATLHVVFANAFVGWPDDAGAFGVAIVSRLGFTRVSRYQWVADIAGSAVSTLSALVSVNEFTYN